MSQWGQHARWPAAAAWLATRLPPALAPLPYTQWGGAWNHREIIESAQDTRVSSKKVLKKMCKSYIFRIYLVSVVECMLQWQNGLILLESAHNGRTFMIGTDQQLIHSLNDSASDLISCSSQVILTGAWSSAGLRGAPAASLVGKARPAAWGVQERSGRFGLLLRSPSPEIITCIYDIINIHIILLSTCHCRKLNISLKSYGYIWEYEIQVF